MNDNDSNTEAMIQAAGKTAPRITPTGIKAVIASEHYFTAAEGRDGAINNENYAGRERPAENDSDLAPLALLTFCVLVLKNGFTVTGKSACASPENFDANIGRKVAFDDAFNQIWPLEGYLLKQQLHQRAVFDASPKTGGGQPPVDNEHVAPGCEQFSAETIAANARPAHQQRVIMERDELADKITKLAAFLPTPTYQRLGDEEQTRLANQLDAMRLYCAVLNQRIDAFPG